MTNENKYYYEINFYGEGHELDWSFYIKSDKELSQIGVVEKLKNEFLGVDGLTIEHINNIDCINIISGEEFTSCCSLPA